MHNWTSCICLTCLCDMCCKYHLFWQATLNVEAKLKKRDQQIASLQEANREVTCNAFYAFDALCIMMLHNVEKKTRTMIS